MNLNQITSNLNNSSNDVINTSHSIFDLVQSAGFVEKTVMISLIIVSFWAWSIALERFFCFMKINNKIAVFEKNFWSGTALDILYNNIHNRIDNPLAAIFVAAMSELQQGGKNVGNDSLKNGLKERTIEAMHLIKNREIARLEKGLSFLANIGSSATFIGLFGTVLGIMNSFQSIANSQNTTLAVVAPGIAEALLATAIGLGVAIPAVIWYNILATRLNNLINKIEDFISELNNLFSKAIDEDNF